MQKQTGKLHQTKKKEEIKVFRTTSEELVFYMKWQQLTTAILQG